LDPIQIIFDIVFMLDIVVTCFTVVHDSDGA
jgi:hypothetical protein